MQRRVIRRSAALAAAALLALAGTAIADGIGADGDTAAGVQNFVDLGTVAPGATVTREVTMRLSCSGIRHVDPDQVVTLSPSSVTIPEAGGSIAATATTVGPVPPGWADDRFGPSGCTTPMSIDSALPSTVTIVAPPISGEDYLFSVSYGRTFSPAGVSDGGSVSGFTIVTFSLDVEDADTTPPTLVGLPADIELVTSDAAGAALDYVPPTATDDRDPAPVVACDPAPGTTAPVGTTLVVCTATDAAGNTVNASFRVTVHLATVTWEEPVRGGAANVTRGRSLPIKVRAWLDGVPLHGPAALEVWSCAARGGGPARTEAADWQADPARWMTVLETSGLAAGCHAVVLVRGGLALGSFDLDVVEPPPGTELKGRQNRGS